MKKLIKAALSALLVCSLSACTDANEKAATTTVNNFFTSLEAGSIDDAYNYVQADASTDFSSMKESMDSITSSFSDYTVSDETKQSLEDALANIVKTTIRSHKITKTEKVSDTEYTFTVTASILNSDDITNALSNVDYNSFISSIYSEVMTIYSSEGENAASDYIVSKMADWFNTDYVGVLKDLTPEDQLITVTVDKSDDTWLITNTTDAQ